MMARWLVLLLACSPDAAPQQKRASKQTLAGDALVYRFIDHAGEAQVTGDLRAAWDKLSWPARLASPYSGLGGDEALRVVELALTDADVENFGKPHEVDPQVKLDAVWNRTRAVYQSKTSLFAPAGSSWRFEVPAATHLRGSMAAVPGGPPLEVVVSLDGKERLRRRLDPAGVWFDFGLAQLFEGEGAHTVVFKAEGPAGGAAFIGDPLLFARDGGAPGPNLLLVIIDTLRADAPMPRLSAMKGAHFTQAITAATWTRPSLLALLGGDFATSLGQSAEEMIPPDSSRRRFYAVAPPLMPRLLQQRGWQADAIGNNFFLLGYPQIGLSLGFETIADVRHPSLDTPAIERAAEAYLTAHRRESWYLQVHFDGPHWPYTPPPEYLARVKVPKGFPDDSMARAYLAEALYADDHLGMLLDALERLHLDERTVVVVVGDHGEVFDHAHDHFVEALGQPTLHHHGWSAYDETIRVPLVIGGVPDAQVKAQVSLIDVMPTVLELLGQDPGRDLRGRSLAACWKAGCADRPALVEGQDVRALRSQGLLYLRRNDGRLRMGGKWVDIDEELYDLAKDPSQHHALLEGFEPMRAEMARLLPVAPVTPVAVTHLRLAADRRPHLVAGTLKSDGPISVRALENAEALPLDGHSLKIILRGPGQIDLAVEQSLSFELQRDGVPIGAREILVGPYALPLLPGAAVEGPRWSWLDAARRPVDGDRGDLLLWRDPSRAVELPASAAHADDEVAGMMQRWGYAQPATPGNAREKN
jgi:arylsulfatase A-like enzyme